MAAATTAALLGNVPPAALQGAATQPKALLCLPKQQVIRVVAGPRTPLQSLHASPEKQVVEALLAVPGKHPARLGGVARRVFCILRFQPVQNLGPNLVVRLRPEATQADVIRQWTDSARERRAEQVTPVEAPLVPTAPSSPCDQERHRK